MDLGAVVREHRQKLRLTQKDLADLAEVSERFVRAIESGKKTVQLDKVIEVIAVLGLDLSVERHIPEALR